MKLKKIGKIKKANIDPYIEYLTERLKHEENGYIRNYIRAKIRYVLGKPAIRHRKITDA